MEPYQNCPSLIALPIRSRTTALRQTCLAELQKGLDLNRLIDATELAVENEQYELAQAIAEAADAFRKNPQLALF